MSDQPTSDFTRLAAEAGGCVKCALSETRTQVVFGTGNPDADLVFVGTWVDGLILLGHRPGDLGKVKQIPKLWNKRVAVFMTHAVNPGRAADKLAAVLEADGADVVAARSLNRRHLAIEAPTFATEVLDSVGAFV